VFRKTALTILDDAGLPARLIADQAGHSQVSMTQDVYMGRGTVDPRAALALDQTLAGVFSTDKPCVDLVEIPSHPV
jgi:integrase